MPKPSRMTIVQIVRVAGRRSMRAEMLGLTALLLFGPCFLTGCRPRSSVLQDRHKRRASAACQTGGGRPGAKPGSASRGRRSTGHRPRRRSRFRDDMVISAGRIDQIHVIATLAPLPLISDRVALRRPSRRIGPLAIGEALDVARVIDRRNLRIFPERSDNVIC